MAVIILAQINNGCIDKAILGSFRSIRGETIITCYLQQIILGGRINDRTSLTDR